MVFFPLSVPTSAEILARGPRPGEPGLAPQMAGGEDSP